MQAIPVVLCADDSRVQYPGLSERQPAFAWERLGANVDIAGAVAFLKDRREVFLDAGVEQMAD